MTAARTGRKQPSIRTLWAIAKSPELHLTDEDLHAVVYLSRGYIREVVIDIGRSALSSN